MTTAEIVRFCRYARAGGFATGITETLAAVEAVRAADAGSERFALRSALCSSKYEWDAFDPLYASFFTQPSAPESRPVVARARGNGMWMLTGASSDSAPCQPDQEVSGAGVHARLRKMDFSSVPQADRETLERLASRLLRGMSRRLSRRLNPALAPGRIDLRRTIRRSISHGGEPFDLRFKRGRRERARIVTLIDISGSMSAYSLFFLRFAHAIHRYFKRADTFLFSTSLKDVTAALRSRSLAGALASLGGVAADWAGGTRIGESLDELTRRYAPLLTPDAVFVIFSDGWDTGEPRRMSRALQSIQQRVRRVIFLNPLLGLADYRPETEAMANALPYIDVFAPAHSLESLLELEKRLSYV